MCLWEVIDAHGDHVLGCHHGPLRIKRHDSLCDSLFHFLLIDNTECRRKQICDSDSNSRPGDIYHPDFQQGKPAYFDESVRNSLQPRFINDTAYQGGVAATAGEIEEDERHQDWVESNGCLFYPLQLVVESLGIWLSLSLETLKIIPENPHLWLAKLSVKQ